MLSLKKMALFICATLWLALAKPGSVPGMPPGRAPGFQYLGNGYDILAGDPFATGMSGKPGFDPGFKSQLFTYTYEKGQTTEDGKWAIPDRSTSRIYETCNGNQLSKMFNSELLYQELISEFAVSVDLPLAKNETKESFSMSTDALWIRKLTDKNELLFALVWSSCYGYQLAMYNYDMPETSPMLQRNVSELPVTYNTTADHDAYLQLIVNFGTHYVASLELGARFGMQYTMGMASTQYLEDKFIDMNLGLQKVASLGWGGRPSGNNYDAVAGNILKNNGMEPRSISIGEKFDGNYTAWMQRAKSNPMPVHYGLKRLDELFSQTNFPNENVLNLYKKQKNMGKALASYCEFQEKRNPGFSCTPQKNPGPMPTPPIPDSISRICVHNQGAYALVWEMVRVEKGGKHILGPKSGWIDNPSTGCIAGSQFGGLQKGDLLTCGGHAIMGRSVACEGGIYPWDPKSRMQAVFTCWGSTLSINCHLTAYNSY